MECNEFRNMVADLFDKQVDEQLRTACEEHLRQCADCRSYYEGLRAAERVVLVDADLKSASHESGILNPLLRRLSPLPLPMREGSNYSKNVGNQVERLSTPLPHREGQGGESAGLRLFRVAAAFIGILLVSAIAVAAVRWLKPATPSAPAPVPTAAAMQEPNMQADVPPVHFNDVRLDSILCVVAPHYGKRVRFDAEEPKAMQLIMEWQPDAPLADFIERLNMFDGLQLQTEGDTIVVKSVVGEEDLL